MSSFRIYKNMQVDSMETQLDENQSQLTTIEGDIQAVESSFPVIDQTYSPQLIESGSSFSVPLTTSVGRYTTIGTVVTIYVKVSWASLAGTSGGSAMTITLPLNSSSTTTPSFPASLYFGVNLSGTNPVSLFGSPSSSILEIQRYSGSAASLPVDIQAGDLSNPGSIELSGVYFTD